MSRPEYIGKEHWMDILQNLLWENDHCLAVFSDKRTDCKQHPEYLYWQKDKVSKERTRLYYYDTIKGIYVETSPKVYYKVLYMAFEQDYIYMELFNIANPMTFYNWKGRPKASE